MKWALRSYVAGFALSILLTAASFIVVSTHVVSSPGLLFIIVLLALTQLIVQLIFFLHLRQESKPRWNLVMFLSTFGLVLILVIGSLWIMNHLNYNMTPDQINSYMNKQGGF